MSVVLETSIGDLVIDLYTDERPNCKSKVISILHFGLLSKLFWICVFFSFYSFVGCKNFLKLCKMKYYHYNLFNNIQKNYIAQTGDPTGTGRGGESIFK